MSRPDELDRRRKFYALGEKAILVYAETGRCVFCPADDVYGTPHGSDCAVGEIAGIEVTAPRINTLVRARRAKGEVIDHGLMIDALLKCRT